MATNTLFGYAVEEQDGKLVITVHGAFATEALRALREDLESGRTPSVFSLMSPLWPIGGLLSGRIALRQAEEVKNQEAEAESLAQEVDQTFEAFQRQMAEFRAALGELQAQATAAAPESPAKPGPKGHE